MLLDPVKVSAVGLSSALLLPGAKSCLSVSAPAVSSASSEEPGPAAGGCPLILPPAWDSFLLGSCSLVMKIQVPRGRE